MRFRNRSVHYYRAHANMKNITLSAEEDVIVRARKTAFSQNKSLNQAFREWLDTYARPEFNLDEYQALMKRLSYARAGRKFTREEMNER